jgi:hypothetical protein
VAELRLSHAAAADGTLRAAWEKRNFTGSAPLASSLVWSRLEPSRRAGFTVVPPARRLALARRAGYACRLGFVALVLASATLNTFRLLRLVRKLARRARAACSTRWKDAEPTLSAVQARCGAKLRVLAHGAVVAGRRTSAIDELPRRARCTCTNFTAGKLPRRTRRTIPSRRIVAVLTGSAVGARCGIRR